MKRSQFSFTNNLVIHRFRYLNINLLISGCCNKIDFTIINLSNCYIITSSNQFKIHYIFKIMPAVTISNSKKIIPQSYIDNVIFTECSKILLTFYIKPLYLIERLPEAESWGLTMIYSRIIRKRSAEILTAAPKTKLLMKQNRKQKPRRTWTRSSAS